MSISEETSQFAENKVVHALGTYKVQFLSQVQELGSGIHQSFELDKVRYGV